MIGCLLLRQHVRQYSKLKYFLKQVRKFSLSFFSLSFLSFTVSLGSNRRLYQHAAWHRGFEHYLIQETVRINFNLASSLLGQLLWLPVQGSDLDYNAQSMGLRNFTQSKQDIETRSFSKYTHVFSCSHLTHFSFPLPHFKSLFSQASLCNSPVISDGGSTHTSVCTYCTRMNVDYCIVFFGGLYQENRIATHLRMASLTGSIGNPQTISVSQGGAILTKKLYLDILWNFINNDIQTIFGTYLNVFVKV